MSATQTAESGAAPPQPGSASIAAEPAQHRASPAQPDHHPLTVTAGPPWRGFLDLPQELRDVVYALCLPPGILTLYLPDNHIWPDSPDMRFDRDYNPDRPDPSRGHSLFLVSRQISREALKLYRSTSVFYLLPNAKRLPTFAGEDALMREEGFQWLSIALDSRAGSDEHGSFDETALSRDRYMHLYPDASLADWRSAVHDQDRQALLCAWDRILWTVGQQNLHWLEINLENCWCCCGCERLVEEMAETICDRLRADPEDDKAKHSDRRAPLVIRFLGTRDEGERDYLRLCLTNGLEREHVIEFAGNFKQCGRDENDEYDYKPVYDRLDAVE